MVIHIQWSGKVGCKEVGLDHVLSFSVEGWLAPGGSFLGEQL